MVAAQYGGPACRPRPPQHGNGSLKICFSSWELRLMEALNSIGWFLPEGKLTPTAIYFPVQGIFRLYST